jgi:hypothetical protein
LRDFTLQISSNNFSDFLKADSFYIPLRNMTISYDIGMNFEDVARFVSRFNNTLETLELNHFTFFNFIDCSNILNNFANLNSLKLNDCHIQCIHNETLEPIRTLKSLTFNKCDENIFKIFTKQETIEKITVCNEDWTWNGFPHDIFNEICRTNKNLDHLVLNGAGTGSYFDCDEFPYKIRKLETTMISFHWYVGIRNARLNFLKAQKGYLKDLTIHELPFDFDGGKVLKFIIEEMGLDNFYYGDIPLILEKVKQIVQQFTASEIQVTSAFEMVKQFTCYKFRLKISKTDIASDEIEKIISVPTDAFKDIQEFEVVDDSAYRGIFGVFLGLFRNMRNVQRLSLKTLDRNINTILECLPEMAFLEEMLLTSTAPRIVERLMAIHKCAPNLKKLSISEKFLSDARDIFEGVDINGI